MEHIAFSPDSRQVAYTWFVAATNRYELRTLSIEVSAAAKPKTLLNGAGVGYIVPFGWSPDRRHIYAMVTREDRSNEIVEISTDAGRPRTIKPLEWRQPEKLSLSPNGRYIAYDASGTQESTNRTIHVLSIDSGLEMPVSQATGARDLSTGLDTGRERHRLHQRPIRNNCGLMDRSDRSGQATESTTAAPA